MKVKWLIIGAGIGGLAAGSFIKKDHGGDFLIVEKSKTLPNNLSNGLHYLHDVNFYTPFPMKYKDCVLTEEIWDTRTNTFSKSAHLPELFSYSKKVMDNMRHPSSIMDPGKRSAVFVPESNDMNDLIKGYESYIGDKFLFDSVVNRIDKKNKIAYVLNCTSGDLQEIEYEFLISTAPLNRFGEMVGFKEMESLKHKPLYITNYQTKNIVPNWMIVLYMSDPKFPPYRLSCFNSIISLESLRELTYDDEVIIKYLIGDLFDYDMESTKKYTWETGRIFGLSKDQRFNLIQELASDGIFLLGRFALWNGKLRMDSTINQAEVITRRVKMYGATLDKELLKQAYEYSI